jgi:hypothetical protein
MGTTYPRREGLKQGQFINNTDNKKHALFVLGITSLGYQNVPYDETMDGWFLDEDAPNYSTGVLLLSCDGPPEAPIDVSCVQYATANPITNVSQCWKDFIWFDYVRSFIASGASGSTTKATNAFVTDDYENVNEVDPDLSTRGIFAYTAASTGLLSLAAMTNWLIAVRGTASKATYGNNKYNRVDGTLISVPFKLPAYVNKWGYKGGLNQLLAGGATGWNKTIRVGYVLKIQPATASFTGDGANNKSIVSGTLEYGMEASVMAKYTTAVVGSSISFERLDNNPPYTACIPYTTYTMLPVSSQCDYIINATLTIIDDAYKMVLMVTKLKTVIPAPVAPLFAAVGMHGTTYSCAYSAVTPTKMTDIVIEQVLMNTNNIISYSLDGTTGGTIDFKVNVDVDGKITLLEVKATPGTTAVDVGTGIHDYFVHYLGS